MGFGFFIKGRLFLLRRLFPRFLGCN